MARYRGVTFWNRATNYKKTAFRATLTCHTPPLLCILALFWAFYRESCVNRVQRHAKTAYFVHRNAKWCGVVHGTAELRDFVQSFGDSCNGVQKTAFRATLSCHTPPLLCIPALFWAFYRESYVNGAQRNAKTANCVQRNAKSCNVVHGNAE